MKLIRNQARKIALLMSTSFLFFSCSQNEIGTENENSTSSLYKKDGVKYTGAEIVEGLFFFKNDVADGIPQLAQIKSQIKNYDNYSAVSSSMNELSAISIDFINNHYPNYLNELQTTVYSGNLFKIGEALEQTAKYIEQAGLSSTKYQSAFLVSDKIYDNEALRNEISALDLSTPEGMNRLNQIVSAESELNINNNDGQRVVTLVAGAIAAVYVGVVAVSIAIAAYSVYFKVAYWGGGSCRRSCSPNQQANIYISNGEIMLEREVLISQIGTFFNP